ncbi:MAG TPA: NlpC/P60 family protein [Patescibacteria group bacterium]|nr:NlpC/P60 family protein [Patescibacteria group bacterium]
MKKNIFKTYMRTLENAPGTKIFRSVFVNDENGREYDVLRGGELSCAYFVSFVLRAFNLIDAPHSTVATTLARMKKAGWHAVSAHESRSGDVVVWEPVPSADGETHAHIGFYLGNEIAVSNNSQTRVPAKHHMTFKGKRSITHIFRFDGWVTHHL